MAINTRKKQKPLIKGHQMVCPRCKTFHDILAYKPMQVIPEYAGQTVPIYVCPGCRWKFAPSPVTLAEHVMVVSPEDLDADD